MIQVYAIGAMIICGLVLLFRRNLELTLPNSTPFILLLVITVWCGVTLFWAINPQRGVLQLFTWIIAILGLVLFTNALRNWTAIKAMLLALFVSCSVLAVIGLLQHYFGLDWIPQAAPPGITFGNRNPAAQFLLLGLPVGAGLLVLTSKTSHRIALVFGILAILVFVFAAKTRSAMIGISVQIVLSALLLIILSKTSRIKAFAIGGAASLACVLIVVVLFTLPGKQNPKINVFRLDSLQELFKWDADRANERISIWANTTNLIRDNWILGVGFDNWKVHYEKYQQAVMPDRLSTFDKTVDDAHNDPLQFFSETGIVGLLLVIIFLGVTLKQALVYLRNGDREKRIFISSILLALSGVLASSFFSFPMYSFGHVFYVVLLFGILTSVTSTKSKISFQLPGSRVILSLIMVLSMVALVVSIKRVKSEQSWARALSAEGYGDIQLMGTYARKAYQQFGFEKEILEVVAASYAKIGLFDKAENTYQELLQFYPYSSLGLVLLAQLYVDSERFEEAYQTYMRLVDIRPNDLLPRYNAALLLCYELNRQEECITQFRRVLEHHPENRGLYNYSEFLMENGQLQLAQEQLEYLVELFPNAEDPRRKLGDLLYFYLGQRGEAIAHYRVLLGHHPNTDNAADLRKIINE